MPRRKRGRPKKNKDITIKSEETRIFAGLVIGFFGIVSVLSPFVSGAAFGKILTLFGIGAVPIGIFFVLVSAALFGYTSRINNNRTLIGFLSLSILTSSAAHFVIPSESALEAAQDGSGGGLLGYLFDSLLISTFGRLASVLVLIIIAIVAFSLISGMTLDQIAAYIKGRKKSPAADGIEDIPQEDEQFIGMYQHDDHKNDAEDIDGPSEFIPSTSKPAELGTSSPMSDGSGTDTDSSKSEEPGEIQFPDWKTPPVSMLTVSRPTVNDPKQYRDKAEIIEKTLKSFGIHAKVADISVGPRVVQYALSITVGMKVSKVKSLGNDLALALAAPSGSVRIEAPIPGTSLIGIEVASHKPEFVTIGDMMNTQTMKEFKGQLPLILGKNIAGDPVIHDLTKMPHLLVAGATGSGKSVCVNTFLCGLLMTHSPDYVKFILVDPKMVELPPYNDIPHLLTPVITDMDKVIYSLEWLVAEMQKRFRILNKASVKNIQQYNSKLGYPALPYIILVVDEMADLMLSSGVDIESKIVRLAQMARAVGIHLVLATQRPSVDVLTGLIKANIPARVGMNVATAVDSRVILDQIGAENLLGDGDMLFKAPDASRPKRIQGAFVSNKEVEEITAFVKSQVDEVEYDTNVTTPKQASSENGSGGVSDDPMFADAVRIVVHAQKASSSMLQRKLRIGYNRAARLIDELYEARVVGPQDGSKPRKVLISDADSFLSRSSEGEE